MPSNGYSCGEPIVYPVNIDMTPTNARPLIPAGDGIFSIFASVFPAGLGTVELEINGRWVPIELGDTFDFGNFGTQREIRIRNQNSVAGEARFIVGATPQMTVQR